MGAADAGSGTKHFDLPSGAAERSLREFSAQSGVQVLFSTNTAAGVKTNGVEGHFTPREAMQRLLEGTKLVVSEKNGALMVSRRPAADDTLEKRRKEAAPNAADRSSDFLKKNETETPTREPMKRNKLLTTLAAAAAMIFGPVSTAQVAPGTAASPDPAEDKTIELSPFVVNANQDVGYVAANTLSGSRLNTPLKDTAASISVMTEEFLSDIGATNLDEALLWANNVQEDLADDPGGSTDNNPNGFFGTSNSYRVRGARASLTRNYFEWNLPRDTYNVERIEESRGPNSVLFGIGSAGGIINSSTKQAHTGRTFFRAGATISSFDGYRGTIDTNLAAMNGKLGVRLNAMYNESGSYLTYGGGEKRGVHLALKYDLTPNTQFRAEYETGDGRDILSAYAVSGEAVLTWIDNGRVTLPSPTAPNADLGISRYGTNINNNARVTYIGNNGTVINMAGQNFGAASTRPIVDLPIADININPGGPGQFRNFYYDAFSAFINHRIGENTHVELGYNRQHTNSVTYQGYGDSGNLSFDPNLSLPGNTTNPYGGSLMFEGTTVRRLSDTTSDDGRIMLSTELDFGRWGHYRLAGMAEYEQRLAKFGPQIEAWSDRPFNNNPENGVNLVYRRNYIENEGDWATYYRNMPTQTGLIQNTVDPVTGRTLSSTWIAQTQGQQEDPNHQTTFLLGLQARYFKNRLVLGLGYREDRLNVDDFGSRRNPLTNIWEVDYDNVSERSYKGRTSTLGLVYHVTPWVSLLYNRADNFSLPNLGLRMLPNSLPGGNPEGEGNDIGLSFTLLEGRLNARAVYYKSGTIGAQGQHGFGSSNTSPTPLSRRIVDGLVAAGLISSEEGDRHRVTANAIVFDTTSEGYEFSLTANPTKNWRLQANYSYTTNFEENVGIELKAWASQELAYFKEFPQELAITGGTIASVIALFEANMEVQFAAEGEELRSNRRHKANLVSRYSFSSGPLKGLFIGGGYRYQSKNLAGRTALPEAAPIWGRAISVADVFAGYTVRKVPLFGEVRLQLNVANVFDQDKPLETLFFNDGTVRRLVRVAPRTWRLSANVEF